MNETDNIGQPDTSRHRIKIDCSDEGIRLIDELKNRTDSASRAELFRRAINVLEWAVSVRESGARIAVEKDGKQEYVRLWI